MANQKHLALIRQGVETWNTWRAKDPSRVSLGVLNADLSDEYGDLYRRADLRRANLQGKDLSNANLVRADLRGADLRGAILTGATLSGANLKGAKLKGADLRDTYLQRANFDDANLSAALLDRAFAADATFNRANLRQATFNQTRFPGAEFKEADLSSSGGRLFPADFREADFQDANLKNAFLMNSNLSEARLRRANLENTILWHAKLIQADLSEAELRGARLSGVDLSNANLEQAVLEDVHLDHVLMIETNLGRAHLTNCHIYGISAWKVNLQDAIQEGFVITPRDEPEVTVDNLEVAQFIYLMINNEKLKDVIDTITSKAVLILGRFTRPRKMVLDAIRDELHKHDYVPIVFDFDKPASRNLTETVTLLARMSRFIIADLSSPKSLPQELTAIIPLLPSVPVQPIISSHQKEYGMYEDWRVYPWVLEIHKYRTLSSLLGALAKKVVAQPEEWIEGQRNQ
jgi:uncharacterized protein YjbI with pentapeptide repeats